LSFDRILPSRLASVNDRTATPIPAILLTMVTIMIVSIIAITTSVLSVWSNGTLDLAIIYTILSVAGAAMPFMKPNLYAASPRVIRGSIGGLPVITIVGALSALFSLYIVYLAFKQPLVVGPIGWQSITATVGVFVLGLAIYLIARLYWRSRGIDPALAMVEIPPE
jgi:amino acid transporter